MQAENQNLSINLYKEDGQPIPTKVDFVTLIEDAVKRLVPNNCVEKNFKVEVVLLRTMPFDYSNEVTDQDGLPEAVNLEPDLELIRLTIYHQGRRLYRQEHTTSELIGEPLRKFVARIAPEVSNFGYSISGPVGTPQNRWRPRPVVKYGSRVVPIQADVAGFGISRNEEQLWPLVSTSEFGIDNAEIDEGTVLTPILSAALNESLTETLPLSDQVEEGGFLIGQVYRRQEAPNTFLLQIKHALPAQFAGASAVHLCLTGEAFVEVKRRLRKEFSGQQLLGWYHTHLFPATGNFGLSHVDIETHRSTFSRSWQIAGLLNLTPNEPRVLRFYEFTDREPKLCQHWINTINHN